MTKKKCQHPYHSVVWEGTDGCCGEEGTQYFAWCEECNEEVDGCIPNPIPYWWPEDVTKKAQEITGYEVEQVPRRKGGGAYTTLGDLLLKRYMKDYEDWMKEPPMWERLKK